MAALAAKHVNYHVMGYYPITPSTEIAEELDEMYAGGEHEIRMIPADGEHGAAGICYGAAVAGGRVLNATSSQGLLYSLEQLPVQAGTRFPMVLNVVTRAVSGPLDILGDHSDIMMAINAGWIMLLARDPQAVYDMNLVAVKLGELAEVRLPVMVAYDGFFTSHQKRRVRHFADAQVVRDWLGAPNTPITVVDPEHPVTIGPYMNNLDLINNKYQQHLAMEAARAALPRVLAEYAALSGRRYPVVDCYLTDDAEAVLVLLNSAAETAKDAADRLRQQGLKVGVVSPNVFRPFPATEIREALHGAKAVIIADRADSCGAGGGNLALEVKAALKDDPDNRALCLARVYGLGGREFYIDEAEDLLREALAAAESGAIAKPFDYLGATPGKPGHIMRQRGPINVEATNLPGLRVERDEETGEIKSHVPSLRELTAIPKRIAPGHGACPGCGIFPGLNQFFRGISGHIVVLFHTGCAMVVTTGYPFSAHRVTYIHNLFQNGAATLSGVVEMFRERKRRGELPADLDLTFVMVSGDGGMDIGMGPTIGTALRGHPLIILEYDNQGYMNTGNQQSYATPLGHATSTSRVGPRQTGKRFQHKDTAQIMAGCHVPYIFTSVEGLKRDLTEKGAKAQWYAKNEGFVYGKFLSACPLSWRYPERLGMKVVHAAVDCCFFPIYEIEHGITRLNYDPEAEGKRIPASDWLGMMGKTRHLTQPEHGEVLAAFEAEVERRWRRLKAMAEHPLL
ncbi:MAG TPA: thiamine pyrophosphate-dependent enzyme [Armatimonadota bacterium]|nr:thiamine pyrophosphate-dependent enzyme [Armatimonadota bacterium]